MQAQQDAKAQAEVKPSQDEARKPIRRALLSVTDKTGLSNSHERSQVTVWSWSPPAALPARLRDAGLAVKDISELTGFPEMLDGRVKTLHPKVHGGILHIRDNAEHQAAVAEHGIVPSTWWW